MAFGPAIAAADSSGQVFFSGRFPGQPANRHQQIPSSGQFGPHCLTLFGHIPSWIALGVFLLRFALQPIWHRRPVWLRSFAAEADFSSPSPSHKSRTWSVGSASLALLFLLDIIFGLYPLFWSGLGPVYAVPVMPCVS
jgi:hypothetical protein